MKIWRLLNRKGGISVLLDTTKLKNELNLDGDDTTIDNLVLSAEEIVISSLEVKDKNLLEQDVLFVRAVYALATALYYDRNLEGGLPLSVKLIVGQLVPKYLESNANDE